MHGGNIYENKVLYDFSVNVNPFGILPEIKHALYESVEHCDCYPPIRPDILSRKLAVHYGVKEEHLLWGNGASELFAAVVHALRPKKVLLLAPSFLGYEWAVKMEGAEIIYYPLQREKGFLLQEDFFDYLKADVDLLFLANPNNPTGQYLSCKWLDEILDYCERREIYVVLDECFMELSEAPQKYSHKSDYYRWQYLLLVDAFTKSFALPGVRLGYLLGKQEILLEKIRSQLPEWNVSVPAQKAGCAAIEQFGTLKEVQKFIKEEKETVRKKLVQMGMEVYPSQANFLLFQCRVPLYESLLKKKFLIRDCKDYRGLSSGFYRIAIKTHRENECLLRGIGQIVAEEKEHDKGNYFCETQRD